MKLTSEIHRPDAEKRKNKRRFDVSHVICEEISTANSQPRSQAHDKRKYFEHVNKPSTAASASHRHYVGFPNYVRNLFPRPTIKRLSRKYFGHVNKPSTAASHLHYVHPEKSDLQGNAVHGAPEGSAGLYESLCHHDCQTNTLIQGSLLCLKTRRNRQKT